MKIQYTQHIKNRLLLRQIDDDLPIKIFEEAAERYADTATGHLLAVMFADLYGKMREVVVAYVVEGDSARILTIHPLKPGQKENRIASGRWRKL